MASQFKLEVIIFPGQSLCHYKMTIKMTESSTKHELDYK